MIDRSNTNEESAAARQWRMRDQLSQKNGAHSTVIQVNGDSYTGEWRNNMKEGKGTYVRKRDGSVYEGEWRADERSGYGTMSVRVNPTAASADTPGDSADSLSGVRSTKKKPVAQAMRKLYAGDWSHNMFGGYGTYFYADGTYHEGEWQDNLQNGWGTRFYADGSRYDGEWRNGERNGQGVLLLPNGDKYEGMWMNDQKEGPGRFHYRAKRQIYHGEWSQDIPKCGSLISAKPYAAAAEGEFQLPVIELANPDAVLQAQRQELMAERFQRSNGTAAEV